MSKPWLETWGRDNDSAGRWVLFSPQSDANHRGRFAEFGDHQALENESQGERASLAAAAPALARALIWAEWDESGQCPACQSPYGAPHDPDCDLDQALTSAGIDATERELLRRPYGPNT